MRSKLSLLSGFILLISEILSAQTDPLKLEATYIGDMAANVSGGIKTGTAYLGLANIKAGFDTEKSRLWKGGLFFINAANAHGGDPSSDLTGDFHTASNIESENITYVHELWFRQSIGRFEFIAGLQDLNSDFVSSEYGSMFINSTFGTPSTIADNVPSPIFPLTAAGVSLKWSLDQANTFKMAFFDGLPTDFEQNPYNLKWDLNKNEGILVFSEYQHSGSGKNDLNHSFRAGVYRHSQVIVTPENRTQYHNFGIYMIIDKMIYRKADNKGGVGLFAQLALSPKAFNSHHIYAGMGMSWQGIFHQRTDDKLGVAVTYAGFNDPLKKAETVFELSYKAKVIENIFIQPDLQYVINPGGTNSTLNNAIIAFLRFGISF